MAPSEGDFADEGAFGDVEVGPAQRDDVVAGQRHVVLDVVQVVSGVRDADVLHGVRPRAADPDRQGPVPRAARVHLRDTTVSSGSAAFDRMVCGTPVCRLVCGEEQGV